MGLNKLETDIEGIALAKHVHHVDLIIICGVTTSMVEDI
jgi:hypothetical protein